MPHLFTYYTVTYALFIYLFVYLLHSHLCLIITTSLSTYYYYYYLLLIYCKVIYAPFIYCTRSRMPLFIYLFIHCKVTYPSFIYCTRSRMPLFIYLFIHCKVIYASSSQRRFLLCVSFRDTIFLYNIHIFPTPMSPHSRIRKPVAGLPTTGALISIKFNNWSTLSLYAIKM
jgi:hypothetical protein